MTPSPLAARVAAFLAAHQVMTLATQDAGGPWAAAVFYACDGLDLLFLSSPSTRHARALAADARAAVTIQRDDAPWSEITGVQAEGRVLPLHGALADDARRLYAGRFPFVGRDAPAPIAAALQRVHWYRFQPRRLLLIDNRLGFGHREELELGA